MRVTPLEIRQKSFEKHFRGYDKDEVNGFLTTLSQEWERVLDENKELRFKLESTEREVTKLREVETSLYKTLKTAEDTGQNVIEQARSAADLHLKESQMNANALVYEAKTKAKDTMLEAEESAKGVLIEMEERLKMMVENYKKLESSREELISELKRLASDTLDRVQRARQMGEDFDPDKYLTFARKETASIIFPNGERSKQARASSMEVVKEVIIDEETVTIESQPKKNQKSFFDNIE